jgi:hypothetical protein
MSLWRNACDEMAGAWRSLRYDLRRRSDADTAGAEFDDPASTGLNTFGGAGLGSLYTGDDEFDRPPRRLVAVSAFGLLALIGAAGSYFAVVNGLGALLVQEPGDPGTRPLAAQAGPAPVETGRQTPTSRLGYGTTLAPIPAPLAEPRRTKVRQSPAPTQPAAARLATPPPRTVAPVPPPCRCTPPVPMPTFPDHGSGGYPSASPSVSPSPSPSASASASPSPSAPDVTDGAGATDGDRNHRPRDHSGY